MTYMKSGTQFIYDAADNIVGVKDLDGTELLFENFGPDIGPLTDAVEAVQVVAAQAVQTSQAATIAAGQANTAVTDLTTTLAGPDGSAIVGFTQPGLGATMRTVGHKLQDWQSIRDYGAIGDGVYRPVSDWYLIGSSVYRGWANLADVQLRYPHVTSATQSIDWAGTQAAVNTGRVAWAPSGKYIMTDPVITTGGGDGVVGEGRGGWTPFASTLVDDDNGTYFLPYGDFPKTFKARHISNCDTSGGVLVNPSAADPYTAAAPVPKYSLQDFTNADAVGATPATSKMFSAMFVCKNAAGSRFENFRVVPWNGPGGQLYYKQNTNASLGTKCDIGVLLYNSSECYVHNVQSVGYWRIAGIAKIIAADVDGETVQGESDHISRCTMQGFAGWLARSQDLHRVVAVGASTVSIQWSASHQFNSSGTVRISGSDRSYTNLSFDGTNLVFEGIDTAGVTTTSELRIAGSNFGSSGTVPHDCYISSLAHHSMLSATSPLLVEADGSQAWTLPSTAIEISGEPNRGYLFEVNTIISNDDRIAHFHNSRDMFFSGCYWEAKPSRSVLGSSANLIPAGCRFIATKQSANLVAHPAGYTSNLKMIGHTDNGAIDFRPAYDAHPSAKYLTGEGLFYPREVQIDKYNMPILAGGGMRVHSFRENVGLSSGKTVELTHGDGYDALLSSRDGTTSILRAGAPSLSLRAPIRHNIGNTAGDIWYTGDSAKFYGVGGTRDLGLSSSAFARSFVTRRYWNATVWDGIGPGSPEGVETAGVGSTFRSTTTGKTWHKETGTGNTGWVVGA